jgi:hypothetical protein
MAGLSQLHGANRPTTGSSNWQEHMPFADSVHAERSNQSSSTWAGFFLRINKGRSSTSRLDFAEARYGRKFAVGSEVRFAFENRRN